MLWYLFLLHFSEWDDNKNVYFFPSATACCDFFFINQPCNTYQRCEDPNATGSPPLEPKKDCSNNKWFPDMNRKDGCSNSDDYDPGWNKEPMKSFYLHDSLQGCCEFFFKDDCQVYHDCEGGDTVGATPVSFILSMNLKNFICKTHVWCFCLCRLQHHHQPDHQGLQLVRLQCLHLQHLLQQPNHQHHRQIIQRIARQQVHLSHQ